MIVCVLLRLDLETRKKPVLCIDWRFAGHTHELTRAEVRPVAFFIGCSLVSSGGGCQIIGLVAISGLQRLTGMMYPDHQSPTNRSFPLSRAIGRFYAKLLFTCAGRVYPLRGFYLFAALGFLFLLRSCNSMLELVAK
ncbi:hypothetical protein F5Y07DRAFT_34647 [Xylaria sp. FL0933]|nr:hypothetical protein F5Y07DRAFT_34647 [Xylaria sp. FL0933]